MNEDAFVSSQQRLHDVCLSGLKVASKFSGVRFLHDSLFQENPAVNVLQTTASVDCSINAERLHPQVLFSTHVNLLTQFWSAARIQHTCSACVKQHLRSVALITIFDRPGTGTASHRRRHSSTR